MKVIKPLYKFNIIPQNLYEVHSGIINSIDNISNRFQSHGRIDMRGLDLNTDRDLVTLSKLVRDSRYETLRFLYVKDGTVLGSEAVSSRNIAYAPIIKRQPELSNIVTAIEKYYNFRLNKLGADGYYLVHNHPSGKPDPSVEDITVCKEFASLVPGFLGGIVVGANTYSIIDTAFDIKTNSFSEDSKLKDSTISVGSVGKVLNYIKNIEKPETSSILIFSDCDFHLLSVETLSNTAFNDKNIFNYIINRKKAEGAFNAFLYTSNEQIFDSALIYVSTNVFTDIFYEETPEKVISARGELQVNPDKNYDEFGRVLSREKNYKY